MDFSRRPKILDWNILSYRPQVFVRFRRSLISFGTDWSFCFVLSGLDSRTWYLGVKPFKNLSLLNALKNKVSDKVSPDTWLGSRISYPGEMKILLQDLNGYSIPVSSFLIKLPSQSRAVSDKIEKYRSFGRTITTYWLQKIKIPNRKITISRSRTLFGPQNSILDRFCHTGPWFAPQRPNPTIFSHKR